VQNTALALFTGSQSRSAGYAQQTSMSHDGPSIKGVTCEDTTVRSLAARSFLCSTVPSPPDCTLLYLKAFLVTYLLMHLYRSLASLPARYRELRMLSSVKEPSICCCTVFELAAGRALLRKQLCSQCWLSCCVVKSCTVARCCSLC